ncbi:MAG: aconitase X [Propionibacteriaceae bacterium]
MELTAEEQDLTRGNAGEAAQFAMEVIIRAAEAADAPRLQEVTCAHIVDTLLYGGGETGPLFVDKLASMGARVRVPTTVNAGSTDAMHPELNRPEADFDFTTARRAMRQVRDMGCQPTFTCSPFQEPQNQLGFGEHVAWGESNAVSYANSVFGARTNRYGNFLSLAAALAGRVPYSGYHVPENRIGQVSFALSGIPDDVLTDGLFYHALGYLVGARAGERVPVIEGLPAGVAADHLKALGAAAASSGAVSMYHLVGVTPEAGTVRDAFGGSLPASTTKITLDDVNAVRRQWATHATGDPVSAVALGAPHLSVDEIGEVHRLLPANEKPKVPIYLAMSRRTEEVVKDRGWDERFAAAGVVLVTDRCAYSPGILSPDLTNVMTDSAKWATYAPACLGATVTIRSIPDCVATALTGRVHGTTEWEVAR